MEHHCELIENEIDNETSLNHQHEMEETVAYKANPVHLANKKLITRNSELLIT